MVVDRSYSEQKLGCASHELAGSAREAQPIRATSVPIFLSRSKRPSAIIDDTIQQASNGQDTTYNGARACQEMSQTAPRFCVNCFQCRNLIVEENPRNAREPMLRLMRRVRLLLRSSFVGVGSGIEIALVRRHAVLVRLEHLAREFVILGSDDFDKVLRAKQKRGSIILLLLVLVRENQEKEAIRTWNIN